MTGPSPSEPPWWAVTPWWQARPTKRVSVAFAVAWISLFTIPACVRFLDERTWVRAVFATGAVLLAVSALATVAWTVMQDRAKRR
jgi:hypothetical protein